MPLPSFLQSLLPSTRRRARKAIPLQQRKFLLEHLEVRAMMAVDSVEPPAGLSNWWPGDGNTNDIAGTDNGTLQSGARFAQGINGSAFRFDGVDDFVSTPTITLQNGLTFEVWVKTTSNATATSYAGDAAQTILGNTNGGWNSFGVQGGLPQYSYYGLTQAWGWQTITAITPVNDGNWHHLAVTHDRSGAVNLYVDGVLDGTGNFRYTPSFTTINRLGAGYLNHNNFDGLLDEMSIYGRALGIDEIQAVVNAGGVGKTRPAGVGAGESAVETDPPAGLTNWWTGDGSASDVVGTSSGTLRNGARFADGHAGNAFNFDGLDDFVEIPTVSLPTGLTFEVWAKTTSDASILNYPGNSAQVILGGVTGGWNSFGVQGGLPRYSYYGLSPEGWRWQSVMAENPISDGNWHHLAVTHNVSGAISLYVDGIVVETGQISYSPSNTKVDRIGAGFQDRSVFDGLLDELSVYNRPLGAGEIQTVFSAGSNGKIKPVEAVTTTSDLTHWWPAEGNATDPAGGNNASLNGNATYAAGKVGASFSLNDEADYLKVPRITLPNGLTYEAWIQSTSSGSTLTYVGNTNLTILGDSSNSVWNNFGIQGGKLTYKHFANNQGWQWQTVAGQTDVTDGNWHHVAVTHDTAGNITLYVDGAIDGAGTIAYSRVNTAIDRIGTGYANQNTFVGKLDEVSIYKRALTANEVQETYRAGLSGTGGVRFISNRDFSTLQAPSMISDTFSSNAEGWQVYDYNGGIQRGNNVIYPVTWEGSGGVNDSPYIWGDDSRWRIDTPETPDSILAYYFYRIWVNAGKVDLRQAEISVSLRGDNLNLHGAQAYFWVLGGSTATSRWHYTAQPVLISEGSWGRPQTIGVVNDESLWTHTFAADPLQPDHALDDVLRNAHSFGFSFLGFTAEVTGKFSMDELLITQVGFRQESPQITPSVGVTDYAENAAPQIIDSAITVSDYDSLDFDTGKLVVDFIYGGTADDRLAIQHSGTEAGQIGVAGSNVTFQGKTIGSFSGGDGTTPLVVKFNANATLSAVQSLLQAVTYENISDHPTIDRGVRIVLTDGDSGTSDLATKAIRILPANDVPQISLPGDAVSYLENDPATLLDDSALVLDPDSTDFDTGTLTVAWLSGGSGDDRLAIRNDGTDVGQIGVTGADVMYEGTVIGGFTGGTGLDALVVTFNEHASAVAVEALLRRLTYENVSDHPVGERTLSVVITDGDGATSNTSTKEIHALPVNDAPRITLSVASLTYTENGPAAALDANAAIADPDSTEFAGGTLTVEFLTIGTAQDRLSISNEGTAAGQIGVVDLDVLFEGTIIGSFTGGIGSDPLVVTFNASASTAAVEALLRSVTFENVSDTPLAGGTVSFVLSDGDGGTSQAAVLDVEVVPVNDAPQVDLSGEALEYAHYDPATVIDNEAIVFDPDSFDFDAGMLTVDLELAGNADEHLGIRDQGTEMGQIGVSATDVLYEGTIIGSFSGGDGTTPLVVVFNANATHSAVEALLRSVTYANVSINPASESTVRFVMTDGDGAESSAATKLIHLQPIVSVGMSV